ncbi:MAG TPA: heptosyltransferase [Sutterella sp.]|nr:heptosyltransferase [Sutterella sp.]
MALPALRLLEASGFQPFLVGKRFTENLMLGMGWRIDPIEGHLTEDLERLYYLRKLLKRPRGLLFPNSLTSALQFALAGIPATGYATDARSLLLKTKIEPPEGELHTVERLFTLVHRALLSWGVTPSFDTVPETLGLRLAQRHISGAKNLKKKYAIGPDYAIISPIARGLYRGQTRHWLQINSVVRTLKDYGIEPLVFPAEDDEQAARIACPDARQLPSTNLGTFAALLKDAKIVISNDSGTSHVAAAVGVKQLTIFGVSPVNRTRPWNPAAEVVGSEDGWPTVDEVNDKLSQMLEN